MRPERLSRRELFVGRSAPGEVVIRPPGVLGEGLEACTGCGACTARCPTGIIHLVERLPSIDFASGECTFCGECRAACPEPVFAEEDVRSFPHVAVVTDNCLARHDIACQSCGECCPEQAIRFRPRIGGPFLPELNEEMCSGCGACLRVCPVGAITLSAREMGGANV